MLREYDLANFKPVQVGDGSSVVICPQTGAIDDLGFIDSTLWIIAISFHSLAHKKKQNNVDKTM